MGACVADLPDPLVNCRQVWLYLRQLGYSCSASQPARAVKENKLSARKGGGFSQAEVRRYAVTHKLKKLPSVESPVDGKPVLPDVDAGQNGAADKKALAAARLMEAQAEKAELALAKEKGLLVPAADMAITLASFGAVVESELKNSLRQSAPKLIGAVNGDQGRVAQLRRMLLDAVDAGLRHAASVDEYKVHFEELGGSQQ